MPSLLDKLKAWANGALKSLTMWFNAMSGALALFIMDLPAMLPELSQALPPAVYKWLLLFNVVGNMLIRFKTKQALSEK